MSSTRTTRFSLENATQQLAEAFNGQSYPVGFHSGVIFNANGLSIQISPDRLYFSPIGQVAEISYLDRIAIFTGFYCRFRCDQQITNALDRVASACGVKLWTATDLRRSPGMCKGNVFLGKLPVETSETVKEEAHG